jgi:basic amino acid/polyamine antiporter, APA family
MPEGGEVPRSNQLNRQIGLFSAIAIVVANMVGTGIFTTSGFILKEVQHPAALLWCWLVGGIFALCGALCYGELGARHPQAGGEYVYLRHAFGRPVAFLSGWISLIVGFSAPIAAASFAFSTYFYRALGKDTHDAYTLNFGELTIIKISSPVVTAIIVVLLISLIHSHSLRLGSRIQNILTLFKVGLLTFFITAGLLVTKGSIHHTFDPISIGSMFSGKFAVALIFVSFAYSGWNAASYLGGEIRNPTRNLPLALGIGTLIVIIFYLLLNWVYTSVLSPDQMQGVLEVGDIAARALFGQAMGRWFSAGIALGLLSVVSAMILAGPRVYYAMSCDRNFFPLFGKVRPAHNTPVYAIGLQAAIAVIMLISATYQQLLIYIGFTLCLFAMLTVIGLMVLRWKENDRSVTYRTWGYPITPLVFIAGNLWIICFSILNQPLPSICGVATIAAGWGGYCYFNHRLRSATAA